MKMLLWRAADAIATAATAAEMRLIDLLCGPFPETDVDRAIQERGPLDQSF